MHKFPKLKTLKVTTDEGKSSDVECAKNLFYKHGIEVTLMVTTAMIEEVIDFLRVDLQYIALFKIQLFIFLMFPINLVALILLNKTSFI